MSDLSAYRDKAANFGKQANQAENDKDYAGAFEFYMKALDIFQHMIKCKCPTSYHNNILSMADKFQSDFLYICRREKSQAERNLSTQSRGVL